MKKCAILILILNSNILLKNKDPTLILALRYPYNFYALHIHQFNNGFLSDRTRSQRSWRHNQRHHSTVSSNFVHHFFVTLLITFLFAGIFKAAKPRRARKTLAWKGKKVSSAICRWISAQKTSVTHETG